MPIAGEDTPGCPPLASARRVLVVILDAIGDCVIASSFMRELRRSAPQAEVTLVVRADTASLFRECPYADTVLEYPPAAGRRTCPHVRVLRAFMFARRAFARRGFDFGFLPRWGVDQRGATALLYFSRSARRVGFSEHGNLEKARWNRDCDCLLTDRLLAARPAHEVQHMLELLEFAGGEVADDGLECWIGDAERARAEHLAEELRTRIAGGRLVAIAPGAGHPKRLWPVDRYAAAAVELTRRHGLTAAVIGAAHERGLADRLVTAIGMGAENLAGRMNPCETAAFIGRCSLVLTNDSAPAHLAAAMGVPVVVVSCHPRNGTPWSDNAPERFAPWRVEHRIVRPARAEIPCRRGMPCARRTLHQADPGWRCRRRSRRVDSRSSDENAQ